MNYEVVELQASVSDFSILRLCHLSLTTIYPLPPLLSQPCLDIYWSFLCPTTPPISSLSLLPQLSATPTTNLLSQSRALSTWKVPTPATRQPPVFIYAPLSACLCLLPFPCTFYPCCRSWSATRSL